jgi:hypothetical protein
VDRLAFGAIERKQLPTDYPLGAFTPDAYPESYFTDISKYPVENQRKIPACGSHAGSFLKNVQDGTRLSPAYLWKKIKQIDGFTPEMGTDMLSIFKSLKNFGTCPFNSSIDDTTQKLETYTSTFNISQEMDADAQDHKIDTYAFTFYPTMEQIKAAIYKHKVVLCLIKIGEEFWKPSWSASDILPLRPPQAIIGGHFVTLYGYDKDRIYFRNEWGDTYGANGNGYFGVNYLPYVTEIGTAVDTSGGRFQRDLSVGMTNLDVYSLQKFLVKNKYGTYTPTGFFGPKTFDSVRAYQLAKNIQPRSGYVGPITRGWINKEYAQNL